MAVTNLKKLTDASKKRAKKLTSTRFQDPEKQTETARTILTKLNSIASDNLRAHQENRELYTLGLSLIEQSIQTHPHKLIEIYNRENSYADKMELNGGRDQFILERTLKPYIKEQNNNQ